MTLRCGRRHLLLLLVSPAHFLAWLQSFPTFHRKRGHAALCCRFSPGTASDLLHVALDDPLTPGPSSPKGREEQLNPNWCAGLTYSSLVSRLSSLLLFVCLWAGCAAEGPPRPPRVQRPVKVNDLTVEQSGRHLRLSFRRPLLATDGRRLTKPIDVSIFRQVTPPGKIPATPSVAGHPWIALPARELARYTHGPAIIYDDRLSPESFNRLLGATLSFVVVTGTRSFRGRWRESGLSNLARIKLLNVSPPVQDLTVAQIPAGVELHWSAPVRGLAPGSLPTLHGYRVYRSTRREPASYALLARTVAARYDDRDVRFDQRYHYRVRALFQSGRYWAESAASIEASITPRDIFPPPAPTGLTGVYTGRGVQLVWNAEATRNLAGYNVYRQEGSHRPERMNTSLLRAPAFADYTAGPQHEYLYYVTSVSLAHNESGPSTRVTVETR